MFCAPGSFGDEFRCIRKGLGNIHLSSVLLRSNAMSRFLQKSAIIQSIWTSPRMRSEGFLFMSADLGVELCLPTVVLRAPPFASTPPFPTVRMKEENKFLRGSCKKCVWESEVLRGCILRCRRNTLLTRAPAVLADLSRLVFLRACFPNSIQGIA